MVPKRCVGIKGMTAPARGHTEIYDADGETKIGEVTNGTSSPCLKQSISMGYIETTSSKVGMEEMMKIRNKMQKSKIVKMLFMESCNYRVPE
eukprot:10712538-Ditylum_brightwellii.AAC.1